MLHGDFQMMLIRKAHRFIRLFQIRGNRFFAVHMAPVRRRHAELRQVVPRVARGNHHDVRLFRAAHLLEKGAFSKQDCMQAVNTKLLTGYEKNIVAEMLFSLGRSDLDTQLAELSKYRANLTPISESAKQNYKKYGALSFKLGILAGLAAMLLVA